MLCLTSQNLSRGLFKRSTQLALLLACCPVLYQPTVAFAQQDSKRIEVYLLNLTYWDIQSGDTLDSIVQHLLPDKPSQHQSLKQNLLRLNPQAFINNNPEQLLAGKRLWMPGHNQKATVPAASPTVAPATTPANTTIEQYSWVAIKRQRR